MPEGQERLNLRATSARQVAGNPFFVAGQLVDASVGIGGCWKSRPLESHAAYRAADQALYAAKADGRKRIAVAADLDEPKVKSASLAA